MLTSSVLIFKSGGRRARQKFSAITVPTCNEEIISINADHKGSNILHVTCGHLESGELPYELIENIKDTNFLRIHKLQSDEFPQHQNMIQNMIHAKSTLLEQIGISKDSKQDTAT